MTSYLRAIAFAFLATACSRAELTMSYDAKPPKDADAARRIAESFSVRAPHGTRAQLDRVMTGVSPQMNYAVGLAPQARLRDALAQIIRDPTAPYPVLIVLAQDKLNDNLYLVAKYLAQKDAKFFPTLASRRVLSVLSGQVLRAEMDGKTEWGRAGLYVERASGNATGEMLRRSASAREIEVDGIGPVRLVFDPHDSPAARLDR